MGPALGCNLLVRVFDKDRQTRRQYNGREISDGSLSFARRFGFFLTKFNTGKSSCCVGGLAKSHLDRTSKPPQKRNIGQSSRRKRRQWSSSPEVMENNVSISHSLDTHQSSGPPTVNEENKSTEENVNNDSFINQAAIDWNERRKEWVGDRSRRTHRASREPIISWCTTYDDLLSNDQPFPQPIPLYEMVDFLVDIWHEEGLYD